MHVAPEPYFAHHWSNQMSKNKQYLHLEICFVSFDINDDHE